MSRQGANLARLTLPQAQAFQCDMLVWRSAAGGRAIGHPGHAALVLRRQPNEGPWRYVGTKNTRPTIRLTDQRYMSFWPHDEKKGLFDKTTAKFRVDHLDDLWQEISPTAEEGLEEGRFAPREGQIVIGVDDDGDDIWGQWPQVIVGIPGLTGARMTRLGIHLGKMVEWAVRFKASDEFNYTFVSRSQNCAGVAVRALVAGGGDAFAEFGGNHAKGNIYMSPNDAQRWGEAVARGIQEVNRMLEVLRDRTAFAPVPRAAKPELMAYGDWKTKTKVDWTIRGRHTVSIDSALKSFHEQSWATGYPAKLKALLTIIKAIREHMRELGGKRDAGYLSLAFDVMDVVAWLAQDGDAPWSPTDFYGARA